MQKSRKISPTLTNSQNKFSNCIPLVKYLHKIEEAKPTSEIKNLYTNSKKDIRWKLVSWQKKCRCTNS